MDFIHLIPLVIEHLEAEKTSNEVKLHMSRIILSTINFGSYYPQKMIDLAIDTFS